MGDDVIRFWLFKQINNYLYNDNSDDSINIGVLPNDVLKYILSVLVLFHYKSNLIIPLNSTILFHNNKLYVTGSNEYNKLGIGNNYKHEIVNNIKVVTSFTDMNFFKNDEIIEKICSGDNHVIILTNKGLYGMGSSIDGQLGLGYHQYEIEYSFSIPTKIKFFNNIKIKDICCGQSHTLILTSSNQLYVMGSNCFGQLGLGDDNNRYKPTLIKNKLIKSIYSNSLSNHSFIITIDNKLYGMGLNNLYQFGIQDDKINDYVFNITEIVFFKKMNIIDISCGYSHSLILIENNCLYGTGDNEYKQLGLPYTIKKPQYELIPFSYTILSIYAGYQQSFIISEDGELYFSGLGLGFDLPISTFTKLNFFNHIKIKTIGCGIQYVMILTEEADLYGYGSNKYGQFGQYFNDIKSSSSGSFKLIKYK